eukprot:TRINITY_DN828_c0_g3_i1.p1 TRINITY_DN828_c0_g3~~TRINITY_DN828_c0_g3_i1.p1  ORF type:complete len:212 (+),score=-10.33 TRINITY_DN828_c0_g3_i1:450-1085(+)
MLFQQSSGIVNILVEKLGRCLKYLTFSLINRLNVSVQKSNFQNTQTELQKQKFQKHNHLKKVLILKRRNSTFQLQNLTFKTCNCKNKHLQNFFYHLFYQFFVYEKFQKGYCTIFNKNILHNLSIEVKIFHSQYARVKFLIRSDRIRQSSEPDSCSQIFLRIFVLVCYISIFLINWNPFLVSTQRKFTSLDQFKLRGRCVGQKYMRDGCWHG